MNTFYLSALYRVEVLVVANNLDEAIALAESWVIPPDICYKDEETGEKVTLLLFEIDTTYEDL